MDVDKLVRVLSVLGYTRARGGDRPGISVFVLLCSVASCPLT
jgi:hypothetical protein